MADQKTILLFDDDPDDLEMLEEAILSLYPQTSIHAVTSLSDFWSCLERLSRQGLPHLIVLDFNMPGVTGADVLLLLRRSRRYRNLPTLVWSTSSSEAHRSASLQSGASHYFVKPASFPDMVQQAKTMLTFCESDG
ncbi:response regulator [Flaviaesturariibacter amylovorans]|uniref:response regulator n=1 Tax=Flaviaesturariibacter amylovorans TaxID=1084520 RepID=UPI0031EB8316